MDLLLYINKNTLAAWRNLPCDKRVFYLSNIKYRHVAVPAINHKKIDKEKSGMKSGNKSIRINGKSVEVTDEVYKVYTKYDRKMRYFEKDLKQERLVYDELGNIIKRVPSREDSLDRLLDESFMQFKDISENVEDTVLNKILAENLHKALDKLTDNEYDLIISLYFHNLTEREYAKRQGVYPNAIHNRKVRILGKLKKLLE